MYKHIGVDCHFHEEKVQNKAIKLRVYKEIKLEYVQFEEHLADFPTAAVAQKQLSDTLFRLGIIDIYALAWVLGVGGWVGGGVGRSVMYVVQYL